MDSLKFAVTWNSSGISGARITVTLGGIMLEGCTFDGNRLAENQRDSPSFTEIPACKVAWIKKVKLDTFKY